MQEFNDFLKNLSNVTSLARGGQKVVYSATHQKYGDVVLKIFFSFDDPRSKREIDIGLNSGIKGIPTIFEQGFLTYEGSETLYVIEERINGTDLQKRLESGERFDLKKTVSFLEQGLAFIKQIEAKGIVHRDIKPANIIMSDDGQVYFLDFGIARIIGENSLTKTEAMLGPHTPGYAAPEQFNNLKKDIDSRADLFSIGVVTYECLTGTNPFREGARSHLEVLQKTETITPVAYNIKGDTEHQLMGIIGSLMGKFPSRRPKNASQAIDWLEATKSTLEY